MNGILAPVVVGTPLKILDALKQSSQETLENLDMQYCVIDEVDRVLGIRGKYHSESGHKEPSPAEILLSALTQTHPDMQVIAASATVGRPLRRELYRIIQGGEGYGEIAVVRPSEATKKPGKQRNRMSTCKIITICNCLPS